MKTKKETGHLKKNHTGRWEIVQPNGRSVELTSGDICEIRIGVVWTQTRIESADGVYYCTTHGIQLQVGLSARLP